MSKQEKSRRQEEAGQAPEHTAQTGKPAEDVFQPVGEEAEQVLAAQLAKAQEEREEYLNLAQRVQADFDNYRRRNQAVRAEAIQDGMNEVLTQLLTVVDSLERAVDAAAKAGQTPPESSEQATPDPSAALRAGVELVLRQLREAMGKFGVADINRLGEPFDPELENAVLQGAPEEGEPGTVCEVFQKGYRTPAKVLRHAMVKVVAG